jgi:hypothetical protein
MSRKIKIRRSCFNREEDEDPEPNEYASPPCYMHEVDPAYFGLASSSDATPRCSRDGERTARDDSSRSRRRTE